MARDEGYGYQGKSAGSSIGSAAASIAKLVTKPKKVYGPVQKKTSGTVRKTTGSRSGNSSSGSRGSSGYSLTSGGGSSRRSYSNGTSSKPKGPTSSKPSVKIPKAAPKKPSIPGINSYLGTDSGYQDVIRGGKRSLEDFLSELTRRKGESETQFGMTKGNMERDRTQQLDALRQEFASRGLINSGLFGEEQGRFQQDFMTQQTALEQQQAALLADIMSQEKNFRREQELAIEQAKQEALQRRAAKYNIGG